jgi:hypothetical protein
VESAQGTLAHQHQSRWGWRLLDPRSESWATLSYSPDTDAYDVRQAGPRQLWDEIETAHQWWINAGNPACTPGDSPSHLAANGLTWPTTTVATETVNATTNMLGSRYPGAYS